MLGWCEGISTRTLTHANKHPHLHTQRIKYGKAISPEATEIPKMTFAVMGSLDSVAGVMQVYMFGGTGTARKQT